MKAGYISILAKMGSAFTEHTQQDKQTPTSILFSICWREPLSYYTAERGGRNTQTKQTDRQMGLAYRGRQTGWQ